jgi:hypothetical protein
MSGSGTVLMLEDAAWNYMRRHGLLHVAHPTGPMMLRAAGVAIEEDALSCLVAYFDEKTWTAHLPPRDESPMLHSLAAEHEAGHVILTEYGVARYRQDSLIDALTPRWRMHRSQIERVAASAGYFSPPDLIAAFPDYTPTRVLMRAAEIRPVAVILHPPKGNPWRSSCMFQPVNLHMPERLEREILQAAREEGRVIPGCGGATAWPYWDTGRLWVAMVYEPLGHVSVG